MSSAQILIPKQPSREMNRERNPPISTSPLFIALRIEPMKPSKTTETVASQKTTYSPKKYSTLTNLVSKSSQCRNSTGSATCSSCGSFSDNSNSIGELRNFPSKNSLSGHSSNSSIDSSGVRRNRLRSLPNHKNRLSNSSLTSLHNRSVSSLQSHNSITSIHSSSSMARQGRFMRRQQSQSLDHLRESLPRGGSNTSLCKNASFESMNYLNQNTSSGAFSRTPSINSLCNASNNNSSTNFSWNSRGIVQMAQRSNGSTVKGVIDELQRIVDETLVLAVAEVAELERNSALVEGQSEEQEKDDKTPRHEAPILQCSMLSQWALADAYYKVVITKYRGIPVIIRAMKAFPDDEDIQGTCCTILSSLTNKVQVFQEGGVNAFLNAMIHHPNSIVVQSAALEGLSALMPLIMHLEENNDEMLLDIEEAAKLAEDMFLTEAGSKTLQELLIQIAKLSN